MKTAVVLFNLGGPSNLQAVKPYLYNLFSDPAIIRIPKPWRTFMAYGFSRLRTPKAKAIYHRLGGKSPLLEHSERQVRALTTRLGENYNVYLIMRYWHPRAEEVVLKIKVYQPNHIVLLPLYPQYSTSTTKSSLMEFDRLRDKLLADVSCKVIECFAEDNGFIQAVTARIKETVCRVKEPYRLLFTAHGLPHQFIKQGDPYKSQVEATVTKVISCLQISPVDFQICYQSRVGVLPWLKPYTIDEIKRAGQEKKSIVVVPISFVCENSETLYELDIQYKEVAEKVGVLGYYRVPTVAEHPFFIQGLADMIKQAV
jgi:ferrochelatase